VRPKTLLEIACRNDYALPADTEEGVSKLYDYRDFAHFSDVWILTTNALQHYEDFRQIVVDYTREAAGLGAVYVEEIFSPAGVHCSISTDDPAMFSTDLSVDYHAAASLGLDRREAYEAGLEGAACDEVTKARLSEIGKSFDWAAIEAVDGQVP
jgi:adenosine deaminase